MQDDFETRLKQLLPTSCGIDPIAAAFAAGQHSASLSIARWRVCTGILVLAAAIPWLMPRDRKVSGSASVVMVARSVEPSPTVETTDPTPQGNILQLQVSVLERGLDGLPRTPLPRARAIRTGDIF